MDTVKDLNNKITEKLNEDVNYLQKEFFIEDLLKVLSEKKKIDIHQQVVDLELKRKYQVDTSTLKDEHKERVDNLKKLTSDNIQKDFIFSELVKYLDVKVDQKELQEHVQKIFGMPSTYELMEESGPDHDKEFTMAVFVKEKECGRGVGASKKMA